MNEKKFEIDTPIGKIVAEGYTEPYPEIVISLVRDDGEVIDLSSVNYNESNFLEHYLWMDTSTDEPTQHNVWPYFDLMIES